MLDIFAQGIVGLDIGSSSVKAVKLRKLKDSYELTGAEIVNLSPEAMEETDQDRKNSFYVEAVKKIFKNKNIANSKVATGISGDSAIIRYIKTPYMGPEELKNMIPYEAEQYIPLGMDQVVLDYQVLAEVEDENQKKLSVLLAAVKNEIMNNHLDILKAARISPAVIDVDAFAICNAYMLNSQDESDSGVRADTIALINIGAKFTLITIVHKGVPQITRDVNIGGNNFTTEIRREYAVSFGQAEELKRQRAAIIVEGDDLLLSAPSENDRDSTKIHEAITPSLNKLTNDIKRSFEFYESTGKKRSVQKILLSGGSSKIRNIDRFLSDRLGIPVELNYPFKNININAKNFDLDYLRTNAVQLNVALGLALRKVAAK